MQYLPLPIVGSSIAIHRHKEYGFVTLVVWL